MFWYSTAETTTRLKETRTPDRKMNPLKRPRLFKDRSASRQQYSWVWWLLPQRKEFFLDSLPAKHHRLCWGLEEANACADVSWLHCIALTAKLKQNKDEECSEISNLLVCPDLGKQEGLALVRFNPHSLLLADCFWTKGTRRAQWLRRKRGTRGGGGSKGKMLSRQLHHSRNPLSFKV